MTTSASALPALAPNDEGRKVVERVNTLIRLYNRPDLFIPSYAADTGTGAAYVTTPSSDIKVYEIGQEFDFKATNANTVTNPTLNVQGLGAGTITKLGGTALVIGDIPANSFNKVIVTSTTPTFQLLSPVVPFVASGATTFLGADVALNNTANYFNGPNTGSLPAGTYRISTIATMGSTSAAARMEAALHDGTNYLQALSYTTAGANFQVSIVQEIIVTIASATTFTLRGRDQSTTSGALQTTGGALAIANKATSITYVRIA